MGNMQPGGLSPLGQPFRTEAAYYPFLLGLIMKKLSSKNIRHIPVELACSIGINEAAVLDMFRFWLDDAESSDEINGIRWFRATIEQLQEHFPFFPKLTLCRIISKLSDLELIHIVKINIGLMDRTNSYSVNYQKVNSFEKMDVN